MVMAFGAELSVRRDGCVDEADAYASGHDGGVLAGPGRQGLLIDFVHEMRRREAGAWLAWYGFR
ncbi:hypothetical protein BS329_03995 [Amycolatopsis coloradensis]|uniref:Uncharacterized protein n=1 Tax=Amycolatopsis coloradensis TaxID=76021 RepID=A0A1R0L047_9PSEU|nr:hypothetical protein BS329_03995 [Amycolatopsis coloradensis]